MQRTMSFVLTLMLAFVIALTSAQSGTKPSGVTTIRGLDIWRGNLPTKGGNSFIILKQFDRDCGPTSAEMVLHYYGKWVTQRDIWSKGGIHTIHAGTFPGEVTQALNGLGVPVHWYNVRSRYPLTRKRELSNLRHWIRESKPCIILLQGGLIDYHWVVVVGYDSDRFLIADPNGYFVWWSNTRLFRYWAFQNAHGKGLGGAFISDAVSLKASPFTCIVPKNPPAGKHFEPMWSKMMETQITGSRRWNPLFKTEGWERTFHFSRRPHYYKVAGVKPAQLANVGGTAQAWVTGSKIEGNSVKVWGRIEYGKVTRGRLWVIVRAYRKGALINPF